MSAAMIGNDEIPTRRYDRRLMGRILRYLRPHWKLLVLGGFFLGLSTGAQLLGPYITKVAIDRYILTKDLAGLNWMVLAYALTVVLGFLFLLAQRYLLEKTGQRAMHDLRLEIFSHLQRQDVRYFDLHPVGRLMTRNIHDVESLQELFSTGVVGILTDACMVVGIVIIMTTMNWQLALIAFTGLLFITYLSRFYRKKARQVFRQSRAALSSLNATLQESISGIATIKAFGREKHILEKFHAINTNYRDILLHGIHYNAMFFPIIEVFSAVTIGVTLWYGGFLIGHSTLLPGVIVAFVQYLQRMYQPIRDVAEKYNVMQAAMAASERIFELLDTPITITNATYTPVRPHGATVVEFENVWLAYQPDEPVLRGISFAVEPGAKVALVGPTGHGKTSIISALCRFYEIQRGAIRLDGVDIRQWNKQELRANLGLVLQEPFLFSGSIADNITLGDQRIDRARLVTACEKARLTDFVARLPLGYDHEVRERGSTFSHGQRQLISLARAFAFDPRVLLLDEATSSIDPETEFLIQEAIRELLADRTALIIAHRLSTIEDADRILVVQHGQIREQGTHAELLANGGLYRTLYDLQFAV